MKLPASSLGRSLPGGQNIGVLALSVELLQLRPQAGALGRGGGGRDAAEYREPAML